MEVTELQDWRVEMEVRGGMEQWARKERLDCPECPVKFKSFICLKVAPH